MSKKKIIIITLCMILLCLLIFIISVFIQNSSSDDKNSNDAKQPNYAVNEKSDVSSNNIAGDDNIKKVSIDVNGITYTSIDILTPAQQTDEANMIRLINSYVDSNIRRPITEVEFSTISSDEIVLATIYYYDEEEQLNKTEDLAILYDKYNTKSFMRCINADYWNSIQNGENAGSE